MAQEITIINRFGNKPLVEKLPVANCYLWKSDEVANELNILDDAMTDFNPEDYGYVIVETPKNKVYYLDENEADRIEQYIMNHGLFRKDK